MFVDGKALTLDDVALHKNQWDLSLIHSEYQ